MSQHKAVIVVPADKDCNVIGTVQERFCDAFGGFSQYRGKGGWQNDGERIVEDHTRIEATADASEKAVREVVTAVAEDVKEALGEDALYCEITEVDQFLV